MHKKNPSTDTTGSESAPLGIVQEIEVSQD